MQAITTAVLLLLRPLFVTAAARAQELAPADLIEQTAAAATGATAAAAAAAVPIVAAGA